MVAVILTMLLLLALALAVLAAVAVPARRAGRELLTDRGQAALEGLRERGAAGTDGGTATGPGADRATVTV
ncbi:MAG: hypothetical protein IE926_07310 [Micrococcales bacterium]|uniref:hypothetical protein n=1 Tax=Phycicoccus sp. TaxID=1902410 RepID=UPI0019945710|nr:hypothetical protein [Phycicoccus sp.]MBD3782751.1 hypothetical protein [Micrococcales bacterium]HMM97346.1 hypothetical protein [Phycicoccus sp.]